MKIYANQLHAPKPSVIIRQVKVLSATSRSMLLAVECLLWDSVSGVMLTSALVSEKFRARNGIPDIGETAICCEQGQSPS